MKKRLFSLVLITCILFSLMAGCGSSTANVTDPTTTGTASATTNSSSASTSTNATTNLSTATAGKYGDTGGLKLPITTAAKCEVTWMTSHPDVEWNNTPFIQEIKKRTGIDLIVQNIPSDAYTEKVNTSLAAKNMPNILNVGVDVANTYGEQGAFLALNKYYDKIPNFKKVIVDTPANSWYLKSYSTEAGNIYGWPIMDLQRKVNHMYMYRKDIFDKNNLTIWKAGDTEGAYQVLKKLKEIYPNSYPVSSKMANNFWWYQMAGWGLYSGVGSMSYNETDKTWYYPYTTKEFKSMADFFKKLYNEGILDPEFMTNTQNAWIAKMAEPEKTFVTFDWISRMDLFYIQVKDSNPKYDLSPAPPMGPTGKTFPLSNLAWYGVVISATTKNNVEALQLVDYLFSPSGATLNTIGVEGEWFNFVDNKPVYTDAELKALPKIDIGNLSKKYGLWNQSMYVRCDRRSLYHALTPKEQAANDIIVNGNLFLPADPILRFTDAVLDRNGELTTNLNTKAFEFAMNYVINSKYGDAEWQKWLNDAKALGLTELEKNYNDAQKKYDAAK